MLSKQKGNMPDSRVELPQGTLDLLILKTLSLEPQHGWAISERVQQVSSDALQVSGSAPARAPRLDQGPLEHNRQQPAG
jgi:hypothetical protein